MLSQRDKEPFCNDVKSTVLYIITVTALIPALNEAHCLVEARDDRTMSILPLTESYGVHGYNTHIEYCRKNHSSTLLSHTTSLSPAVEVQHVHLNHRQGFKSHCVAMGLISQNIAEKLSR